MSGWVESFPPLQQPMRYGNKAFRQWHGRLLQEAVPTCARIIDAHPNAEAIRAQHTQKKDATSGAAADADSAAPAAAAAAAVGASSSSPSPALPVTLPEVELAAYLADSFGNATRIDYGTGHELTFVIFLYALGKLGLLGSADLPALGLRAFPAYLRVCRRLQRTYGLEPAGSHGVWSLDDYHFLVFLFGSAQLLTHRHIRPRSIHSREVLEAYARDYLYLGAVGFIADVKVGAPFAEHSPVLNDIAELPSWGKVNEGLARMYRAEVLGKLPVVQHLVFGSLVPPTWTPSRAPVPSDATGHLYAYLDAEAGAGAGVGGGSGDVTSPEGQDEVPLDHSTSAVAPWTTEPLCMHMHHRHAGAGGPAPASTVTGVAPWAAVSGAGRGGGGGVGGGGSAAPGSPTGTSSFVEAFGNVRHIHAAHAPPEKGGMSPRSPRSPRADGGGEG
jgi:serine/threonine-protein phosphatase 2A activator